MLAGIESAPEVLDCEIVLKFRIGLEIFESCCDNAVEQVGDKHCRYALGLICRINCYQNHINGVGLAENQ